MFYTKRLMFRAVEVEHDLQALNRWLNDVDYRFALFFDAPTPVSTAGSRKFWEELVKNSEEKGFPFFAVCEKPHEADLPHQLDAYADHSIKDGKVRYPLIGILSINAHRFSFSKRSASVGIAFDHRCVGRGYGTETMMWACDYVFNSLNLHRLHLDVRTENTAAIKCYSKVGFTHEGIAREAFFYDGSWHDTATMAILEHEWRANKA